MANFITSLFGADKTRTAIVHGRTLEDYKEQDNDDRDLEKILTEVVTGRSKNPVDHVDTEKDKALIQGDKAESLVLKQGKPQLRFFKCKDVNGNWIFDFLLRGKEPPKVIREKRGFEWIGIKEWLVAVYGERKYNAMKGFVRDYRRLHRMEELHAIRRNFEMGLKIKKRA